MSKLLYEYDDYRYERAGPTSDCHAYFRINQQSHGNDEARYRSDDSRISCYDRDQDDDELSSNDHDYKRQRTESNE